LSSVLTVNAGSTSLKLCLVEGETSRPVDGFEPADAVGHRVVHGGARYTEPVLIDDEVEDAIDELSRIAPLHNTPALRAIREARAALPHVPHVAVFDTAFHATIPQEASTYAIPQAWRDWGVRRYGFHGIAVQSVVSQLDAARIVACHLGGGCSVTAVLNGHSIDTTMGFTPLEGVPMATRAGSVDPGALVYLLRHHLSVEGLDFALEHESGLAGLSGLSGDVRELEGSDQPAARLALDVFTYRVATAVGAMAVALDGLDALVFTAGIGENSAAVREAVCSRLEFLGVELDPSANASAQPDVVVSASGSAVRVTVIEAREDLVAAREARRLLQ